jgi:ADP-ribose pyrophosphatase
VKDNRNPTSNQSEEDGTAGEQGGAGPERGAARRLDLRRVYDGRVINLDVETVQFPNGSVGMLEMIRHPGASAVLPFLTGASGDDPQILLLRQYRYAAESYLYEVPAGRLERGEEPAACARRELKEEAGCEARSIRLLTTIYTTPGFTDERIHLFIAEGLTRGEATPEPDEVIETETMPISRALMMIRDGEIKDGKTALAILFAAGFQLEERE